MRSYVPAYTLRTPASLDEALDLLAQHPGQWRPFAGGTDLMVLLEAGRLSHKDYVSLWGLADLRVVEATPDSLTLGATTTYTDLLENPIVSREFPLLSAAAAETGGVANQNRGTIAGNIANASPAADSPPALLVYDAELELVSRRGSRIVPYDRFHRAYKEMDLGPDEIIRGITLRRHHRFTHQGFRKIGARRAQAISKVCFAGGVSLDEGVITRVRLAAASVAPTVLRLRAAESALEGRRVDAGTIAAATEAAAAEIAPIDDLRSTREYRRRVLRNVVEEFLTALL